MSFPPLLSEHAAGVFANLQTKLVFLERRWCQGSELTRSSPEDLSAQPQASCYTILRLIIR